MSRGVLSRVATSPPSPSEFRSVSAAVCRSRSCRYVPIAATSLPRYTYVVRKRVREKRVAAACLCSTFSQHDSPLLSSQPATRDSPSLFPPPREERQIAKSRAQLLPRSSTRESARADRWNERTDVDRTDFSVRGISHGIMSAPQAPVKLRNGVVKQVRIYRTPIDFSRTAMHFAALSLSAPRRHDVDLLSVRWVPAGEPRRGTYGCNLEYRRQSDVPRVS